MERSWIETIEACREAVAQCPYDESVYQQLIRAQLQAGDETGAMDTYEELRRVLQENFDVLPSEETRALIKEAGARTGDGRYSPEALEAMLTENGSLKGVNICDFSEFKLHYRAEQRMAPRRGDAVHILILTLNGKDGSAPAPDKATIGMRRLETVIQSCLRSEDVAAPCSATQFVVMLVQATYESSLKVARRLTDAFRDQYPKSCLALQTAVMPLKCPD